MRGEMPYPQRTLASALLVAASASLGCTSAYMPRPGPRISVVLENGAPILVKQGRKYPPGMFGSGLVDAVNGNTKAEASASTYQSLTVGGFVVGLLGAGAAGAGLGILTYEAASGREVMSPGALVGLAVGGAVVSLVGSSLTAAAQTYYWDAINIYNDSIEPTWVAPPSGYQPGYPPGYPPGYQPGYPPGAAPARPYDPQPRPLPPAQPVPITPAPPAGPANPPPGAR